MADPEPETCPCRCPRCLAAAEREAKRSKRPKAFSKHWILSMIVLGLGLTGVVGPRVAVVFLLIGVGVAGLLGVGPIARINLHAEH